MDEKFQWQLPPDEHSNEYAIAAVCGFSRFVFMKAAKSTEALEAAQFLFELAGIFGLSPLLLRCLMLCLLLSLTVCQKDNTLVHKTCKLLHDVTTKHPSIMASAKNPLGLWAGLQCVQDLAQKPNWQLVEHINHCMMTSELDEGYFPALLW